MKKACDMSVRNIKILKSKARELLFAGRNYFELILAFIITTTFCIVPIVICYLTSELFDELYITVLLLAIEIFISLPLFSGIYRMVGMAVQNQGHGLIDIFYAFSSIKTYLKVIFMNFISFLKYVTPVSVSFIVSSVAAEILGSFNVLHEVAVAIGIILMTVVLLLFLPVCSRFYAVRFLVMTEDLGAIKALNSSWRITKHKAVKLTFLNISLMPLTVLSMAALLVPFVMYTFPFLICVYSVTCRKLFRADETQKILIELQNDISPEADAEGVEEINEQHS